MTRELKHPTFEIEEHDDGLLMRFIVPGSKFGAVQIVLDKNEISDFAGALDEMYEERFSGV